jgi:hypothetical protein
VTAPVAVHLDTGGRPRCGHPNAHYMSAGEAGVTCRICLGLMTGTHHAGVTWADPRPHGTIAAYRRHYRHGEKPCEACRQAELRRQEDCRERAREVAA